MTRDGSDPRRLIGLAVLALLIGLLVWLPTSDDPFIRVYPLEDDVDLDPRGAFTCEAGWTVVAPGRLAYAGGVVARARFADPITKHSTAAAPSGVGEPVNDLRVGFRVRPEAGTDLEVAWQAPDGWAVHLTLSTEAGPRAQGLRVLWPGGTATQTWARGLEVGRTSRVDLRVDQGRVRAHIDGRLVAESGIVAATGSRQEQALALGARGGALEIDGLTLDRRRPHP